MARIWMSGLEAGHREVFDSYDVATISAAQARMGVYSLFLSTSAHYARVTFAASKSEIFCRFGLRASYGYPNLGTLLAMRDSAGGRQITIALHPYIHAIQVRRGSYDGTLLAAGGIIHKDRWHCIEFHLVVADVGGVFQLKIDGMQVINFSGDTQATANANIQGFQIGRTGVFERSSLGYYDDIAFNDILGGINDSWIGRGGIPAIFPTGAGFSTDLQLFPNTGEANWEDVDEVPPDDDMSYVFDTLIDDHDSYVASNLAATGTITAVQWLARARSDLVGNPEIARILRIGGVDYQGADIDVVAAYDYYPEILDEDLDAGPGAWTVAAINGIELGVKIR